MCTALGERLEPMNKPLLLSSGDPTQPRFTSFLVHYTWLHSTDLTVGPHTLPRPALSGWAPLLHLLKSGASLRLLHAAFPSLSCARGLSQSDLAAFTQCHQGGC